MENTYQKYLEKFRDPRFFTLALVILAFAILIIFFRKPLAPFVISLVLAYFLDGLICRLMEYYPSRKIALVIVFPSFLLLYLVMIIGPLQLAAKQTILLIKRLPEMAPKIQALFLSFLEYLSEVLPPDRQEKLTGVLMENLKSWGQYFVTTTISSLNEISLWLVYLVLIPLLVFFMVKDKERLQKSFLRLLPRERELVNRVWEETEVRISNYIQGKVWEILLVGTVSTLVFYLMGFEYPSLLGLLTGFSVIIPFVGAFGAAIPLFILGYVQWGATGDLWWIMIAYLVIQVVDGNIVAPLIFSEAVKLHPLFILLSVFIFGSLWGLWGVFFAIPMATLIKSILEGLLEMKMPRSGWKKLISR